MCMRYTSYWGGRNHIAFIGDSHIRQLFLGFVRCLNSSGSNSRDDVGGYRAHKDVHFHDRHTNARVVCGFHFACIGDVLLGVAF